MNGFSISITEKGTKKYPLHSHTNWEIMYYLEGSGHLATKNEKIPFSQGSIIIVPPKVEHGSVSSDGFVNISVGGDFNHLFMFDSIIKQQDNVNKDGEKLARLILENRHGDPQYLDSVCNAYAHFLLQNSQYEKRINREIAKIIDEVNKNFTDPDFNIGELLYNSGYAEDYIRAEFKKITSYSPIDFLTKLRIEHAKKLMEIYGQGISVAEVSESCGFDDSVYFSRRFKQFCGASPADYKKQHTKKPRN